MSPQEITPTLCPVGFRGVFTDRYTRIPHDEYEVVEWSPSANLVKFRNLALNPPAPAFWKKADEARLVEALPMRPPNWSYSTYRAMLRYKGQSFAIVSPDGKNPLTPKQIVVLLTDLNGIVPDISNLDEGQDEPQLPVRSLYGGMSVVVTP